MHNVAMEQPMMETGPVAGSPYSQIFRIPISDD
jgi:hypothetical protein